MPIKDLTARRLYRKDYIKKWLKDPEHHRKHRAMVTSRNLAERAKVQQLIFDFRCNGCTRCPEKRHPCLDAHHVDPTQKDFAIGTARAHRFSLVRVRDELKKCICLCRNCHAMLHHEERIDTKATGIINVSAG